MTKPCSGGCLAGARTSCRRFARIVRSMWLNRAVVEASSCSRCGPIVRSIFCPVLSCLHASGKAEAKPHLQVKIQGMLLPDCFYTTMIIKIIYHTRFHIQSQLTGKVYLCTDGCRHRPLQGADFQRMGFRLPLFIIDDIYGFQSS